MTLVRSLEI